MRAAQRDGGLDGATVVIAGASSGIGRATARAFAAQGARLVLAARRRDMLEDAAAECRRAGGDAIAVPADVTSPSDMRHLLDAAIDRYGGVDVWINNAGVGAVGWFEDVPLDAHRRTIETNLLGPLNGAHAVLPHFIDRGRGVLINTNSIGAWVYPPGAVAYAAAKAGLHGLTEALRHEMRRHPGVHVCAIYPSFVDTPGLKHAGNYTGRTLNPRGPMQSPERIARLMVDLAAHPRRRVPVGLPTLLGRVAYALAPDLVGRAMLAGVEMALARATPGRNGSGNLFGPPQDRMAVRGGGQSLLPLAVGLGAAGLLAAGALAAVRRAA